MLTKSMIYKRKPIITKPLEKRYGYWKVIGDVVLVNGILRVLCECVCETKRFIPINNLRHGITKSCGCKAKENLITTLINNGKYPTLASKYPKEYRRWRNILYNCQTENIEVCEEFKTNFDVYLKSVGSIPQYKCLIRKNDTLPLSFTNFKIVDRGDLLRDVHLILDEFTPLKISPARKHQLRNRKKGLCILCHRKNFKADLCRKHYRKRLTNQKLKYKNTHAK